MFYRVAADVTYSDGYGALRTFGILAGVNSRSTFLGAGTITTLQHVLYETYDFNSNSWGGVGGSRSGAVKVGFATNRIEVTVSLGGLEGTANIFVNINGTIVRVMYNQPVELTRVGLYLGWHSMGIIFDNFEFEVIEADE